jgi:flotillin
MEPIAIIIVAVVVFFVTVLALVSRYKRCPSDKILVVYGKTGGSSAKCIHGGGAFVWPFLSISEKASIRRLYLSRCESGIIF